MRVLIVACCWLAALNWGCAFTLTPITATFEPDGRGAVRSFRLDNESSNRVAFQVSVLTREMDEFGREQNLPVTNLFAFFPSQGIILPRESQVVRVMWKGPKQLAQELNFRLLAEELPVAFGGDAAAEREGRINMLLRYMGTLYVAPKQARPQLEILRTRVLQTNNLAFLDLYLENRGTAHQLLTDTRLTLTPKGEPAVVLSKDRLQGLESENILAKSRRHFVVNCPAELVGKELDVKLRVDAP